MRSIASVPGRDRRRHTHESACRRCRSVRCGHGRPRVDRQHQGSTGPRVPPTWAMVQRPTPWRQAIAQARARRATQCGKHTPKQVRVRRARAAAAAAAHAAAERLLHSARRRRTAGSHAPTKFPVKTSRIAFTFQDVLSTPVGAAFPGCSSLKPIPGACLTSIARPWPRQSRRQRRHGRKEMTQKRGAAPLHRGVPPPLALPFPLCVCG